MCSRGNGKRKSEELLSVFQVLLASSHRPATSSHRHTSGGEPKGSEPKEERNVSFSNLSLCSPNSTYLTLRLCFTIQCWSRLRKTLRAACEELRCSASSPTGRIQTQRQLNGNTLRMLGCKVDKADKCRCLCKK